jgi:hypothetical protein
MVQAKRRGLSETLGTFILIATAIAGSAIAVSAFYVLVSPGQQSTMQVQTVQITQGIYVSTIQLLVSNTGTTQLSSLVLQVMGAQASTASFSGSLSLVDASTGNGLSATTSMNLSGPNLSVSTTLGTNLLPGRAIAVTVTIARTSPGANLFVPNNPYVVTLTSTPYSQAVVKVLAKSA